MLDRYGKCPNEECKMDWDGGDILNNLRLLHVLSGKSEEDLVNLAFQAYGYQKSNPKHFSKVIAISVVNDVHEGGELHYTQEDAPPKAPDPDFYMCPNCRQVWDSDTGEQFTSLIEAKRKRYEPNSRELPDPFEI